ncbi:hypothetical protein G3M48_007085 [Beauveria asiatica]|uniref:Uncharacterized protein n=1 Tax=Beauveria asiatica TaxID=1069075 RepID=A0AAW0RNM2_9HYPO
MSFETSNNTLRRSDPDATREQWVDQSDLAWTEESASELESLWDDESSTCDDEDCSCDDESFSWDDEDEVRMSLLCTARDPIPTSDGSMDWRPKDGRQDTSMWEAATDCGVAAETMVSTDIEMLDASTEPAYNDAEEPEEMDWEPCHCTDAGNDTVMSDMP